MKEVKKMSDEKFEALLSSLARIELLIKTIMENKYGRKEATRVYKEIVKLVDDNLFAKNKDDE